MIDCRRDPSTPSTRPEPAPDGGGPVFLPRRRPSKLALELLGQQPLEPAPWPAVHPLDAAAPAVRSVVEPAG